MTLSHLTILALAMALLAASGASSAEGSKLKFIGVIYSDSMGAPLVNPESVACLGDSGLIVADTGNGRLLRYSMQNGQAAGGVEIKTAEMSYPIEVQATSKGQILVLDGKKHRILRLDENGKFMHFLEFKNVPSAETIMPKSFKIDNRDNVYILDIFGERVVVLDPQETFIKQVPVPLAEGFVTDVAVSPERTIYLLDSVKSQVFVATADSKSFVPLSGELKQYARFPVNLWISPQNLLYLLDGHGGSVVALRSDGSVQGKSLDFGWSEGALYYPSQLCGNSANLVFIAERGSNRVQFFKLGS